MEISESKGVDGTCTHARKKLCECRMFATQYHLGFCPVIEDADISCPFHFSDCPAHKAEEFGGEYMHT